MENNNPNKDSDSWFKNIDWLDVSKWLLGVIGALILILHQQIETNHSDIKTLEKDISSMREQIIHAHAEVSELKIFVTDYFLDQLNKEKDC